MPINGEEKRITFNLLQLQITQLIESHSWRTMPFGHNPPQNYIWGSYPIVDVGGYFLGNLRGYNEGIDHV